MSRALHAPMTEEEHVHDLHLIPPSDKERTIPTIWIQFLQNLSIPVSKPQISANF